MVRVVKEKLPPCCSTPQEYYMKKLKPLVILLSVMLIWYSFTLRAHADDQAYQVILTSYACEADSSNLMYPCGQPRWGGNAYESGLACPVAWRNRRFEIPGYGTFRCDDTAFQENLYGLPHVDLRVPTVYQARQIGIRRITIYDANRSLTNTSTQGNNANSITYTVSAGDSLSTIAERYNTTVSTIRSHNNLTSNTIRIGQQLQIPLASTQASTTTTTTTTTTNVTGNSAGVHVVVPGDSLSGIAAKYNTTVELIRTNNRWPSYVIRIGDELQVPGVPPGPNNAVRSAMTHTVRQGESIYMIARQYNVSYLSILEANNLQTPHLIQPGQELVIPRP